MLWARTLLKLEGGSWAAWHLAVCVSFFFSFCMPFLSTDINEVVEGYTKQDLLHLYKSVKQHTKAWNDICKHPMVCTPPQPAPLFFCVAHALLLCSSTQWQCWAITVLIKTGMRCHSNRMWIECTEGQMAVQVAAKLGMHAVLSFIHCANLHHKQKGIGNE